MVYDTGVREQYDLEGGASLFGVYLAFDHGWFLKHIKTLLSADINTGKRRVLWSMCHLSREEVERFRSELQDGVTGLSMEWVEALVDACDGYLNYEKSEYNSAIASPRF